MPQLPVSLHIRAPHSAGWLSRPVIVNPVPPRWSPWLRPSGVPLPSPPRRQEASREPRRWHRTHQRGSTDPPLRPCARTPRPSELAPARSGTPAGVAGPAHAGPATGGSVAAEGPRSGEPQGPESPPTAAHPRPAPLPGGGRLSGRRDGEPEHDQSFLPPAPLPCPGPQEGTTDPAARLPGAYRGAQGCAPSAGRLRPPSRSPGGCSFFGEAGKRERKKGGREGGGKRLRSREREVCKGRKWRRPRPVREINGNQSPGSQQRNLLPQRSPARAIAPPRPGSPGRPSHRSRRQRSAPAPGPAEGWALPPAPAPNAGPGQAGGREGGREAARRGRAGPADPRGDAMGRGEGGGEN